MLFVVFYCKIMRLSLVESLIIVYGVYGVIFFLLCLGWALCFLGGGNKLPMVSLDVVGSPESAKEVWCK